MKAVLFAALLGFNAMAADTEVVIGKIYALGGDAKGEPLFIQRTEIRTDGTFRRTKAVIHDAGQNVVMTEIAVFKDGLLVEQDVEQMQIKERYELRVKDGKTTFRTFKNTGGAEKLDEEKSETTPADFLTGPGFEPFLRAQHKRLNNGETVGAQFGVFELARSVRFEFKRMGRSPAGDTLKVRMEPASFWLSVLVSPIDMEVDAKSLRLVHYKGRTPLRTKVKNDWKPLDAEIRYSLEPAKP